MGRYARRAIAGLTAAVFPHYCVRCGKEGALLCDMCRMTVDASMGGVFCCPGCGDPSASGRRCDSRSCRTHPLDLHIAMGSYGDPSLRTLMRLYKYEGIREAGDVLDALFRRFLTRHGHIIATTFGGASCVGVPLRRFKRALRGFDQVRPFVAAMHEMTGTAMPGFRLVRTHGGHPQARMTDDVGRRENVRGMFSVRGTVPERCVIVDDVFTTGATLGETASVLRARGARHVAAITVLRA